MKTTRFIPYGRQSIDQADIDAVVSVLRSDHLTQGPAVPAFERSVAGYCAVPHAVAANSATSALHIACLALDVGPGDRVWTSPITFIASANCARYCGADVDFVDIDSRTWNIGIDALASKLETAERTGRLPKLLIPVHFGGEPCDMAAMNVLARRYSFRVIEDASHAIGAHYGGTPIGACQHSDIAVFSFHPVKIVTTAEGGMATTRSAALAARMARLRSHGMTREPAEMTRPPDGPWYYEQIDLGFNYRMTEMQAALGVSQMAHLDAWVQRRHAIANRYDRELAKLPLTLPVRAAGNRSALHLYIVLIDDAAPLDRARLFERLRAAGVGVNVHYIPVHLQPYYRQLGFGPGDYPASEAYYRRALTLPMYAALSDDEQGEVIALLQAALA